jgi:prophage regulatory protein
MPFLRLPEVKRLTGLSRSSIYLRIKAGHFPAPVRLGGRAVGWVEEEITAWARDRVLESRLNLRPVIASPATSIPFSRKTA